MWVGVGVLWFLYIRFAGWVVLGNVGVDFVFVVLLVCFAGCGLVALRDLLW